MIRKQLYITTEQQHKLWRLAKRGGCTEAEVVRFAIDRVPDPDGAVADRLQEAGLLAPPREEPGLPTGREAEKLRHELEVLLEGQIRPLGLSDAVMEDRR